MLWLFSGRLHYHGPASNLDDEKPEMESIGASTRSKGDNASGRSVSDKERL